MEVFTKLSVLVKSKAKTKKLYFLESEKPYMFAEKDSLWSKDFVQSFRTRLLPTFRTVCYPDWKNTPEFLLYNVQRDNMAAGKLSQPFYHLSDNLSFPHSFGFLRLHKVWNAIRPEGSHTSGNNEFKSIKSRSTRPCDTPFMQMTNVYLQYL